MKISDDVRVDIAQCVRMFELDNSSIGGNCMARAMLGQAVLRECGIPNHLQVGGVLYRAGHDPVRDTLRFCLPNNRGGYSGGQFIGHVWNKLPTIGEYADFSCGDWEAECDELWEASVGADRALGRIVWDAPVLPFIWQSAVSLTRAWRSQGEPEIGRIWYGGYVGRREPDYAAYSTAVQQVMPLIRTYVADYRLKERLSDLD